MAALCALLLAPAVPAWAEEAKLALKPQICALSENEPLCRELIDIRWRAGEPKQLCLFVDAEKQPLACWREQASGDYEYRANTENSLVFELRLQPSDRILTREIFNVIREEAEYRYRRRKPWNFF